MVLPRMIIYSRDWEYKLRLSVRKTKIATARVILRRVWQERLKQKL